MLTVVTGLPGASKTSNVLALVEAERIIKLDDGTTKKRPVYYWGIPELKLDWLPMHGPQSTQDAARLRYDADPQESDPMDGRAWWELPAGSIFVVDECQLVWPPDNGKPPPYCEALSRHRHRGFDAYVMTQSPTLVHNSVRKVAQRHIHLTRPFSGNYCNWFEWENVVTDPNSRTERKAARHSRKSLPKAVWGQYRSATVHTVKRRLPVKQLVTLAGALAGVALSVWFIFHHFAKRSEAAQVSTAQVMGEPSRQLEPTRAVVTRDFKPESRIPHVGAWLWSSPFFDKIVEVKTAPRITGCMRMTVGDEQTCTCSNDQGGRADVSQGVCEDYMAGRHYDPLREYVDVKAENVRRLDAANSSGGDPTEGDPLESAGSPHSSGS